LEFSWEGATAELLETAPFDSTTIFQGAVGQLRKREAFELRVRLGVPKGSADDTNYPLSALNPEYPATFSDFTVERVELVGTDLKLIATRQQGTTPAQL
jgi:hypothetical protein